MKYRCYVTRVTLEYFEIDVEAINQGEAQRLAVTRVVEDPATYQLGRRHQMMGVEDVMRELPDEPNEAPSRDAQRG